MISLVDFKNRNAASNNDNNYVNSANEWNTYVYVLFDSSRVIDKANE